jgi:hypothetical protein
MNLELMSGWVCFGGVVTVVLAGIYALTPTIDWRDGERNPRMEKEHKMPVDSDPSGAAGFGIFLAFVSILLELFT